MTPIYKKACLNCKYYILNFQCAAFIDGIPLEIINGEEDHLKPLKNQKNDFTFEPITDKKEIKK